LPRRLIKRDPQKRLFSTNVMRRTAAVTAPKLSAKFPALRRLR
jgi:hypothetical protein